MVYKNTDFFMSNPSVLDYHYLDIQDSIPSELAINKNSTVAQINSTTKTQAGLWIALTIIATWTVCFIRFLSLDLSQTNWVIIGLALLLQTFLYTGLFITAHDAMHGSLYPNNLKLNHLIGSIAVTLYGLFSYEELLKKHWLHHRYPASDNDPDFHDGEHQNLISWYLYFMSRYWSWWRLIKWAFVFHSIQLLFHISILNLALFWIIPFICSSFQLFYFGTFLTHREPPGGYQNDHCAQSNSLPIFWSFMTCYHFGYHQEHHQYPNVPWWQLPNVRNPQLSP